MEYVLMLFVVLGILALIIVNSKFLDKFTNRGLTYLFFSILTLLFIPIVFSIAFSIAIYIFVIGVCFYIYKKLR